MLKGNEHFIILKLISGEEIMAILKNESEDFIEIDNVMSIKTIPIYETGKEQIAASPFCQFGEKTPFVLNKKNIIFVKNMHHLFIPYYVKMVRDHYEDLRIVPNTRNSIEEKIKKQQELEEKLNGLFYVPGNDTIN